MVLVPCTMDSATNPRRLPSGSTYSLLHGTCCAQKFAVPRAIGIHDVGDVISAVAEFMVRVLQLPRAMGTHDVAGVEASPCVIG